MRSLTIKSTGISYRELCTVAYLKVIRFAESQAHTLMFLVGAAMLYSGLNEAVYAYSGTFEDACGGVIWLAEGPFGALVTAAAGIGAIIASAVGGFKAAWCLLVVAVGAFILRSYISLFSGTCSSTYGLVGSNGNAVSISVY